MVIGKMTKEMDLEKKFGLLAINMKEFGKMIKEKVKVLCFGTMEIKLMHFGKTIKCGEQEK